MKILVTGGTGFVGRVLVPLLESRGHEVCSTGVEPGSAPRTQALRLPSAAECRRVLEAVQPEAVIHLAAVAFPPDAEKDPGRAFQVNTEGTLRLALALNELDPAGKIRLIFASTAQVYDASARPGAEEIVLSEESPLGPQNTYSVTKLAAELAAEGLSARVGRPLHVFRPFNHSGPGQDPSLVISNFCRQAARIEAGLEEPVIETGNLAVARDFTHVLDVARAYALAVEGQAPPGTYNLASGVATPLAELLERLARLIGRPFRTEPRPEKMRPGEPLSLRGSARKFQLVSGWAPKISLDTLLGEVLDYWRKHP